MKPHLNSLSMNYTKKAANCDDLQKEFLDALLKVMVEEGIKLNLLGTSSSLMLHVTRLFSHLNMIKDTHQEMAGIFEPFVKPYEDVSSKI